MTGKKPMADSFPTLTRNDLDRVIRVCGGAGSGNFGHKGRPGQVGGSGPGGGDATAGPYDPETYSSLLALLKEKGGFSFQPVLEKHAPPDGYIVSPYSKRSKRIPEGEITERDLYAYYVKNYDLLQDEDKYFGGWLSEGEVFLDVSIPITSLEEANAIAVQHNQRAFWDLKNNVEIQTVWPKGQTPVFHD